MALQNVIYKTGDIFSYIIHSWIFIIIFSTLVVYYKTKNFDIITVLLIGVLVFFYYIFYNSMTGNGIAQSVSSIGYPIPHN